MAVSNGKARNAGKRNDRRGRWRGHEDFGLKRVLPLHSRPKHSMQECRHAPWEKSMVGGGGQRRKVSVGGFVMRGASVPISLRIRLRIPLRRLFSYFLWRWEISSTRAFRRNTCSFPNRPHAARAVQNSCRLAKPRIEKRTITQSCMFQCFPDRCPDIRKKLQTEV